MYISKLFSIALVSLATGTYSAAVIPRAVDCNLTTQTLPNLSSIKASCTKIVVGDLVTPGGKTLDLTGLKSGTVLIFQGTTTLGYKEWEGDLIAISGENIQVQGAKGHVINGQGEKYWDGKGGNGGKQKPPLLRLKKLNNSKITGLNILNTPVFAVKVSNCNGLEISGVTINNKAGNNPVSSSDKSTLAHNTDAFDVGSGSNNIHIHDSNIYNQDDCLAVNSGTNIIFERNNCYTGHGLSVAPRGSGFLTVSNVTIADCNVYDSMYGLRVKVSTDSTGKVSDIHFNNLKLNNISKWGIGIETDYANGGSSGHPSDKVPITGLYLDNVTGTVAKSGTNVFVLVKSASNWKWSGVNVTGGRKQLKCDGIPAGSGASC